MTNWKPKDLKDELENCICSALNDNAKEIEISWEGEPEGPEFIHEDDFDDVVKQAINDIMQSDYINIKFKGDK